MPEAVKKRHIMGMNPDSPTPASTEAPPAVRAPAPARGNLSVKELAQAVLDRTLRPRVGEIQRLAEAVLARPKKDKKKKNKSADGKADTKAASGKKRKQAKIPGQAG